MSDFCQQKKKTFFELVELTHFSIAYSRIYKLRRCWSSEEAAVVLSELSNCE